jgi:hypothetical protein
MPTLNEGQSRNSRTAHTLGLTGTLGLAVGVLLLVGCSSTDGVAVAGGSTVTTTSAAATALPTTTPTTTTPTTTTPTTTTPTTTAPPFTTVPLQVLFTPAGFARHETTTGRLSLALPTDWDLVEIPKSLPAGTSLFAAAGDGSATVNVIEEAGTVPADQLLAEVQRRLASNSEAKIASVEIAGRQAVSANWTTNGVSAVQVVVPVGDATAWVTWGGTAPKLRSSGAPPAALEIVNTVVPLS